MRVFDPNQMTSLPHSLARLKIIPGLISSSDIKVQWSLYEDTVFGRQGKEPVEDILAFWHTMKQQTPELAEIALKYLSVPINSVDAERSFSAYNNVVSDKRHNLSDESTKIKMLVGLYYNSSTSPAVNKGQ